MTETLENQTQTNLTLTKFGLTGVKFVPTVYLSYQASIGQIIAAQRVRRAGKNLALGQALYENEERAKLRNAYAEFESARAEYLEASANLRALDLLVTAKGAIVTAKLSEINTCQYYKDCQAAKLNGELLVAQAALAEATVNRTKVDAIASAFPKMKAKALQVLSLTNSPNSVVQPWVNSHD